MRTMERIITSTKKGVFSRNSPKSKQTGPLHIGMRYIGCKKGKKNNEETCGYSLFCAAFLVITLPIRINAPAESITPMIADSQYARLRSRNASPRFGKA